MPTSVPTISDRLLSDADAHCLHVHAAAAEHAGFLQQEQRALIHQRAWLTMLAPKACGGAELALPDVVRLEEALAAVDGSSAWVVTLCAGAGWFAGFLTPAFAREILGTPQLCIAGSGGPTGFADVEGDGFRLTGQWDYASGAPMATHFTLNAVLREHGLILKNELGAPRIRAFIVPAANVTMLPSWKSIGLAATASHSYAIDGQWVGKEHAFDIDAAHATASGPLYRFPFMGLAFVTLSANLAGMASHFLRLARPLIEQRRHARTGLPLKDCPHVMDELAGYEHEIEGARTHFYAQLDAAWAIVVVGTPVSEEQAAALQCASLALANLARRAVDALYPYCGLQAAREGTDINRVWRDLHTATQHSLFLP